MILKKMPLAIRESMESDPIGFSIGFLLHPNGHQGEDYVAPK